MNPLRGIVALPLVFLVGCAANEPSPGERLLDIARSYQTFTKIDTSMQLTAVFCRVAPPRMMDVSASTDSPTHGKKLYFLYAKHRLPTEEGETNPVGQVVVKEAWIPEEVKDDGKPLKSVTRKVNVLRDGKIAEQEEEFLPYARKAGRLYHAKEMSGLFIMFKLDPKTPDTDNGWVYGTVTPDGRTVTGAGRLESCMKCHQKAPFDRVFGLPKD